MINLTSKDLKVFLPLLSAKILCSDPQQNDHLYCNKKFLRRNSSSLPYELEVGVRDLGV